MRHCLSAFILWPLAALLLASCASRQVAATLLDVETYIQERPDSALATLRSIDTTTLTTPKLRAHYALLHAMALDKNWIDTTDVNVVMPAVEYYDRHPSGIRRAKAWYYLGRIQYNRGDYADAIISFTRALDYAGTIEDDRFKSLLYQAMGDTYSNTCMPEEAYRYSELAFLSAKACGDDKLAMASRYRMAQGLTNLKRTEEADSLFSCLIAEKDSANQQVMPFILSDYALLRVNSFDDYSAGVSLFQEALSILGRLPSVNHWGAYSYSLAMIGDVERADSFFHKLEMTPAGETYAYKTWRSKALSQEGQYEKAFHLLNESNDQRTEMMLDILRQSAVRSQRDFYALEKTKTEEAKRLITWIFVLSILLLIAVMMSGYLLLRRKHEHDKQKARLLSRENASLQKAVESLSDRVTEMNVQQASLQREFTTHLQSSFREWGKLYKAFYHPGKSPVDVKDDVYYEAKNAMARLSDDEEGQKLLECRLNELFDEVMTHYREDFPDCSEKDYRFASFVFAGFDPSVLKAAFQISSMPATYERKSRLKDSIARSSAKFKNQYLLFFR
jgi:tetratricopeptide (TPR) repeat protein